MRTVLLACDPELRAEIKRHIRRGQTAAIKEASVLSSALIILGGLVQGDVMVIDAAIQPAEGEAEESAQLLLYKVIAEHAKTIRIIVIGQNWEQLYNLGPTGAGGTIGDDQNLPQLAEMILKP